MQSAAIWNDVWEAGTAKKILKTSSLNVAILRNLNDVLEVGTAEKIRNKQVA